MPGFTQATQRSVLDSLFTGTVYLAFFNTVPSDDGTGGVEVSGPGYARTAVLTTDWNAASGGGPAVKTNSVTKISPTASGSWGTVNGWGLFSAITGGTLIVADYLGPDTWQPFTVAAAGTPATLEIPANGFSNADLTAVSAKYGGVLPATAGSWAGLLTVANAATNSCTVGVNATGAGDGQIRRVVPQAITTGQWLQMVANAISVTLG